jgi:hypothetical protein
MSAYMPVPSVSQQHFEYNIEVPMNDDVEKNTQNVMTYLDRSHIKPFEVHYWRDNEETKTRGFLITSQYNAHEYIYHLFNPFNPVYTCYVKTRIVM